jgi:hypothetical protein
LPRKNPVTKLTPRTGMIETNAHITASFAASRTALFAAGDKSAIELRLWGFAAAAAAVSTPAPLPLCKAANLLLNTLPMIVKHSVPPNGSANRISDITAASRSGHTPDACSAHGMTRIPVPAPARIRIPFTTEVERALVAQVSAARPAVSRIVPSVSG